MEKKKETRIFCSGESYRYNYCNSYFHFHLLFLIYARLVEFCRLWTDFEVGIFFMISYRKLIRTWSTFVLRVLCWLYLSVCFESLNYTTDFWTRRILHQMSLCLMVHSFISFSFGYALFWDFPCYLSCLYELFVVLLGSFISKVWTTRFRGVVTELSSCCLWISLIPSPWTPMRGLDSLLCGSFYVLHLIFFFPIFYLSLCSYCVKVWYC